MYSMFRYTGNLLSNGLNFDDDDPLEAADLPKSFYQLDVGSDSEGSSLPRSLGGVSGAGQSNLSTEVAALIQSEMASQSRSVLYSENCMEHIQNRLLLSMCKMEKNPNF